MDPLAHTLVGASLAETGLKRITPLAATALVVGANLPDVDAVTYLMQPDLSLGFRRGITHGIVADLIWPFVLAGLLVLWARAFRRPDAPPIRPGPLLLVCAVGVFSHPAFDWLNSYGIRLLMPLDGRWFYGDTLFIVDPWLWLLAGTSVALAWTRRRSGAILLATVALLTTALVVATDLAPIVARVVWVGGVLAIVTLRVRVGRAGAAAAEHLIPRVARVTLVALVVYVAGMRTTTALARGQATEWLSAQGIAADVVAPMPLPARPLARDVVARAGDRYYFVLVDWLREPEIRFSGPPMPVGGPTPITDAALAAPHVQGLRTWLRFPSYEVLPRADGGYRVIVRDVRFWRSQGAVGRGLGTSVVDLDRTLRPAPPH